MFLAAPGKHPQTPGVYDLTLACHTGGPIEAVSSTPLLLPDGTRPRRHAAEAADTDALAIALDRLRRGDAVTKIANQLGIGRPAPYRSLGPHLSDAPDPRSASTADQDSIRSPRKAWTWILRSDDQP